MFDKFSDGLKELIQQCAEWNKESANSVARKTEADNGGMGGLDDDIPFLPHGYRRAWSAV